MRPARVGRPLGEVSMALLSAARQGPATVRQLAERGCVGFDAARLTAPRLLRSGALVPLTEVRPRLLALAPQQELSAAAAGCGPMSDLDRFFTVAARGDLSVDFGG
jgi:hypothetical protein